MKFSPGLVALIGSGETAAAGGLAFEELVSDCKRPIRISFLETPAGFELNSTIVIQRIADYIKVRLQNYNPEIYLIPARKRGTHFSTEDARLLEPMLGSDLIFMGPGSPTYAVKQLNQTLAWEWLQASHRLGASIALASAATVAVGKYCLPVYEIYKAGEELHWKPGLDFFAVFGLSLVIIPHWNNSDGGAELDTSRCFMGVERFNKLYEMLPNPITVVGLDEHTVLIFDFHDQVCRVIGNGQVHLFQEKKVISFQKGDLFPIQELGAFHLPEYPSQEISQLNFEEATRLRKLVKDNIKIRQAIPVRVKELVELRHQARQNQDWIQADILRQQLADEGWRVIDTPSGPLLERI